MNNETRKKVVGDIEKAKGLLSQIASVRADTAYMLIDNVQSLLQNEQEGKEVDVSTFNSSSYIEELCNPKDYVCPNCAQVELNEWCKYCDQCGQKLIWPDNEKKWEG